MKQVRFVSDLGDNVDNTLEMLADRILGHIPLEVCHVVRQLHCRQSNTQYINMPYRVISEISK